MSQASVQIGRVPRLEAGSKYLLHCRKKGKEISPIFPSPLGDFIRPLHEHGAGAMVDVMVAKSLAKLSYYAAVQRCAWLREGC